MTELWLIGCFHNDPSGPNLLRTALADIAPDLITVEISRYSIEFRRTRGPRLRAEMEEALLKISKEHKMFGAEILNHPYIYALWKNLFMPYEYAEALRCADGGGAGVFPVDTATQARGYLKELKKAVARENIGALFKRSPAQFFAELEEARGRAFRSLEAPKKWEQAEGRRDAYMASRIRRLIAESEPRVAAHIGGWQHVLPGFPLYERLRDLKPKAILL